jgi:hypothetical protein
LVMASLDGDIGTYPRHSRGDMHARDCGDVRCKILVGAHGPPLASMFF